MYVACICVLHVCHMHITCIYVYPMPVAYYMHVTCMYITCILHACIHILQVYCYINTNQKKAGVVILVSDKAYSRAKNFVNTKESKLTVLKESYQQETSVENKRSKNLLKCNGE